MNFKKVKLGNTFWILLILYLFGYTSILGGPFGVAKVFFVIFLVGALLFYIFFYILARFLKRKNFQNSADVKIKVDAKIIE